jgi:hypothetical protein
MATVIGAIALATTIVMVALRRFGRAGQAPPRLPVSDVEPFDD